VTKNFWTEQLIDAYVRHAGTVRFELVTRALLMHLPSSPQRVVDVGGGYGRQAVMLARAGHSVVIVDFDRVMLALAQDVLAEEDEIVQLRVKMFESEGHTAADLAGRNFDLACCHSVLMYQADPKPMLYTLVELVRPGGLISVLSLNTEAVAMRSGLRGCWREAATSLVAGTEIAGHYVATSMHSRDDVTKILEAAGAKVVAWYGVGIFSDHLAGKPDVDEVAEICALEWLAGCRDPYRHIARCYHLLAVKL
jgi:S-adenosylmethionine-dependent methyltransferase